MAFASKSDEQIYYQLGFNFLENAVQMNDTLNELQLQAMQTQSVAGNARERE